MSRDATIHREVSPEQAMGEIVETIRDAYDPDKIILFGSRIWGEPDEWSDLDILVIKETDKREIERRIEVAGLLDRFHRRPYWLPIDVLVKTPGEIRRRLEIGDSFVREIIASGRVVYERGVV
jgi:predicted nucleotidyltransferase